MTEDRRNYDALLQAMADMKELILTRETACQLALIKRLDDHDRSIKTLWKIVARINYPAQVIGWAVIITIGAVLTVFGGKIGNFLWNKVGG